jgi:hypothetical protein
MTLAGILPPENFRQMIEIGDIIKLRPSIFNDEFTNPKIGWSDKYLYEDMFEFVSLWFADLQQEGDMARTIFGSSESKVIRIERSADGQPFEVITDLFRIIYPEAIRKNELTLQNSNQEALKQFKSDKELIEYLEFFEKEYLNGLFSIMERENNKMDKYKFGFHMMKREGKWQNP